MISPKDITIVVPHLAGIPESDYSLRQCLDSLSETLPNTKIIVSFNAEPEVLGANVFKFPWKPYEPLFVFSQGQCKAVNAAVATTNSPFILVTNDDMVYPPGWFEKLTTDIPVEVGKPICISPKLIEPRPGASTFETYFCGGAGGDFDKHKFLDFAKDYKGSGWRTGFNLPFLISRDLWDTIGGYDINYDPWGSNSDSDLEYKIKLSGVQPMQNTNAIVYHFSQTSGTFSPEHQDAWNKNFAYFQNKWGFPRTDNGIWEANFLIPDKEQGRIFNPDWEGKYAKH